MVGLLTALPFHPSPLAGGADPIKGVRVRLALLLCLQTMAKSDCRALQPHWPLIFPSQAPLQPRPLSPTVATALLFDPSPKVRSMAAATISSILEGPAQRTYLSVAEAKASTSKAPARGFTTLSASLGRMVVSLHTGEFQFSFKA